MISYPEALGILRSVSPIGESVTVPLSEALGHVADEHLTASSAIPSFANAAMDGFALRADDTSIAPVELNVSGRVTAGNAPAPAEGQTCEIMTGAPLPQGFDSVVKVEDVEIVARDGDGRPTRIALTSAVRKGDHVRLPGEDFTPGQRIAAPGTRLGAAQIMALAAAGIGTVRIRRPLDVSIFATGAEVADDPGVDLAPGQIRNATTPFLIAALRTLGLSPRYEGNMADSAADFESGLTDAANGSDLIISTGAVSMGALDFVPTSLERIGAKILFRKVAIKPGKPIVFAELPNGALFLGLPGNPVSSAVGLRFFLWPLVERLVSLSPERLPNARLAHDLKTKKRRQSLRQFQKAFAFLDDEFRLCVRLLDGQESFKISPLLAANCWAIIEENSDGLSARDPVSIASIIPGQPIDIAVGDPS